MQPGFLDRTHEPDRPVEAVVIRDGQPGQALDDGPRDQIVRGRCPVQERKISMCMELGIWDDRHGRRSGMGSGGGVR